MSRGPKRNYNERKISPKVRASKFPYLPEKVEEILDYYQMNVSQLARRTYIKQSSLSRCLNGHSSLSEQSVHLLSQSLDDPIPLWWLTAGPEAGKLKDVLRKEKQQEEEPAPSLDVLNKVRDILTAPAHDDPEIMRVHRVLVDMIDMAWATVQRRPMVSAPDENDKLRQSQKVIDSDKKTGKGGKTL